jgi:peptidylprolyl isomerase
MVVQDRNANKKRNQALLGAVAGVVVIGALVAVLIGVNGSDDEKETSAAAPAASSAAPVSEPSSAAPAQPGVDPALQTKPVVEKGTGDVTKLVVKTIVQGKGPKLASGQTIQANYVGVTYKDGKQFDSSWDNGQPAVFPVGVGQLIKGWDKGLVGVNVGSRVQLDIPAEDAYGENAESGRPSGDLRFVVDILQAR